jgi:hypothetical protein
MHVQSIELVISFITFAMVYLLSVSFVGYFKAWVANKMGDDTPVKAGFLTLNPLSHIDFMGGLCLFLFKIGWGARIPIDPKKIQGGTSVSRWIKLLLVYWSQSIAHVGLAVIAMAMLLIIFGTSALPLSVDTMLSGELAQVNFAQAYPEMSSWVISLAPVLIASIYFNAFLAVFTLVFYGVIELFLMYLTQNYPEYDQYTTIFTILIYILLVLSLVIPELRIAMIAGIYLLAQSIASLFVSL